MLPEPVEEGKAGRGRSAAVAVNLEGWAGGAHRPPQVLLAAGAAAAPGRCGLADASPRGQESRFGGGREEAGASGGRTVRTRAGAGGGVWGPGRGGRRRQPGREAGAAAGIWVLAERGAPRSRAQLGLREVSAGCRGYLRGRGARRVLRPGGGGGDAGAAARWRLGAVTGRLGRPEGSRPGPARPCDPLYSCHHSGTFGAAPNGAMGRPAPPPSPRPRGGRRAPRSAFRAAAGATRGWFR